VPTEPTAETKAALNSWEGQDRAGKIAGAVLLPLLVPMMAFVAPILWLEGNWWPAAYCTVAVLFGGYQLFQMLRPRG
jgi:hypothetical protein